MACRRDPIARICSYDVAVNVGSSLTSDKPEHCFFSRLIFAVLLCRAAEAKEFILKALVRHVGGGQYEGMTVPET